eukprot:augustus_masked-scaffold_17-processed-gene-0.5-mRNA-1 protein AED:1.00 eAED:1.00 QI:0/0/0/0/1/1/5/0/602
MLQCPDLKCYKCLGKGHIAHNCPQNNKKNSVNNKDKREGREKKKKGGAGQTVLEPKEDTEEDNLTADAREEDGSSGTSASRAKVEEGSGYRDRSKTIVYAPKEGFIELRTLADEKGSTFFGQTRIFLVDSEFPEIFIGRRVLENFDCLSEQILRNLTEEEMNKEAPEKRKVVATNSIEVAGIILRRADGDGESLKKEKEGRASEEEQKDLQERIRQRRLMEQLGLPGGDNIVIPIEEMEEEVLKELETYVGEEEEAKTEIRAKIKEMRRIMPRIVLSKLSSVKFVLKKNAPESITMKARAVGAQMVVWLRNKLAMMKKMYLIRLAKKIESNYLARIFAVPKKDPAKLRLEGNMKPINTLTVKRAQKLLVLEQQPNHTRGGLIDGRIDICSGYDQVPVKEGSKKLLWPDDAMWNSLSPVYLLQGLTNIPMLLQQLIVEEMLKDTGCYTNTPNGMIQWIDDFCFFMSSEEKYVQVLIAFLKQLRRMGNNNVPNEMPLCVETTNGPISKYLRSFLSEYRLEEGERPDLLEQVVYYMNKSPSSANDGLSPNEVIMFQRDEDTMLSKEDWALPLIDKKTKKVIWRTPEDITEVTRNVQGMRTKLEED